MDSGLFPLYVRMLNLSDRQIEAGPNLRYSANDKKDLDIIDVIEKIYKSGASFCKLPSNQGTSNENSKANEMPKCCRRGFDIQKINQRKIELNDPFGDLDDLEDECELLAEDEQCGVNVILTTNGNFISELSGKANKVKIIRPTDYFKK